jgi:protein gp37
MWVNIDLMSIDWMVVGGESGPHARSMHPGWVRRIKSQCEDAGAAFYFKQWGEWVPVERASRDRALQKNERWLNLAGGQDLNADEMWRMRRRAR